MKITFCGAAKIVTGSCYLIEANGHKILVDCGMYQGSKDITKLNYDPFLFDPKEISHVLLTHAHIDHSGLLPKLVKHGFKGKIYSTSATIDLTKALLEDSAHIQEMDTEHENRRRLRQGVPEREPLYSKEDAKNTSSLFLKVEYDKEYKVNDSMKVRFQDAGHILGSSIIELWVTEKTEHDDHGDSKEVPYFGGPTRKIVFSGDLGQWDVPIIKDPTIIKEADYVLIESTYGDRLHEDKTLRTKMLGNICKDTFSRGGKVLIPTFAVERTQELLYSFGELLENNEFPKDKEIFLDSPLAIKATEIFKAHKECYDKQALSKKNIFTLPNLKYTRNAKDSMALNHYNPPCVIMAGSGMCTGGRIRHHFKHGIWDSKNTILFVGYQAKSTLGRHLISGAKKVRMMGSEFVVKARIEKIDGYSAHADKNELLQWIEGFEKHPKHVFIVHGEPGPQETFKGVLVGKGFDCKIPDLGQSFEL